MSVTECMLPPTPEAPAPKQPNRFFDEKPDATLDDILAWMRTGLPGDAQRAAWHRFFKTVDNCQAFLNALLAGEHVPAAALLKVEREQFNWTLFDVMRDDPRWGLDVVPREAGWSESAAVLFWQRYGGKDFDHLRVAQLTDLPDTPETDAKLQEVQQTILTGKHGEQVLALGLVKDNRLLQSKLFASFHTGFQVPEDVLREFARTFNIEDLPAAWSGTDVFEDDESFDSAQFYAITTRAKKLGLNWDQISAVAITQLYRMLDAGRVDIVDAKPLLEVAVATRAGGRPHVSLGEKLAPYDNDMFAQFERALSFAATRLKNVTPAQQAGIDQIRADQAESAVERERLFSEVWLPNMLPAAEAAAIRGLPSGYLRELYATQWEQGYEGYRAAVKARTSAAV